MPLFCDPDCLIPAARSKRPLLNHEDNETASVAENILQQYSHDLSPTEFTTLTHNVIQLYAEDIQDALANRVVFEFLQYALIEGSGLQFISDSNPFPDQVKGKPSVTLFCGLDSVTIRFNAAHAATSPRPMFTLPGCLDPFTFLEGSSAYLTWNSTAELPKTVNDVDCDIDFRQRGLWLRDRRLMIINDLAQGKLTAMAAHARFLNELNHVLALKLSCAWGGENQRAITLLYQQALGNLIPKINSAFYDHCLSLHFEGADLADCLRMAIYPVRQKAMRERNATQSFLHKKLLDFSFRLTGARHPSTNWRRAIRAKILEMLTPSERAYLEEWWGQTLAYYKSKVSTRTLAKCDEYQLQFSQIITECRIYIQSAQNQEKEYRAQSIKKIREVRQLSREELSKLLQAPSSLITAIEEGLEEVDSSLIHRIAHALSVHPVNLFIDQHSS